VTFQFFQFLKKYFSQSNKKKTKQIVTKSKQFKKNFFFFFSVSTSSSVSSSVSVSSRQLRTIDRACPQVDRAFYYFIDF
jgi:hypothetical protein